MIKFTLLFFSLFLHVCFNANTWSKDERMRLQRFSFDSLESPTDPSNKYLNNPKAIEFGKSLFSDKRMSSNGEIACSSCHIKEYSFTDNRKLSIGLREGFRNTSTLLNSGYQHWFFADGAKDSLWSQALSSIENPDEQNFSRLEVMRLIAKDKNYRSQYIKIFKNPLPNDSELQSLPSKAGPNAALKDLITWKKLTKQQRHETNIVFTNIGKAIASFVATIESPRTRFDSFIEDIQKNSTSNILNKSEQRGLRLFLSQESGCANCHSGPLFSNKTFHNVATGIPGKDNGRSEIIESLVRDKFNCLGKYSDAKKEECVELNFINRDKHQLAGSYKTSMLRGISGSAPYMHDGRFDNLFDLIRHYESSSQIKPSTTDLTPIKLNDQQRQDLVNFLLTL